MTTATGSYATQSALADMIGGGQTFSEDDEALQATICDYVNQYLEDEMKQVVAPIEAEDPYTYDGQGLTHLYLPFPPSASVNIGGFTEVTLVEVAPSTGGDFQTVPDTDYFLRGQQTMLGPYQWLVLSDRSSSWHRWPMGYGTVRVTGTAGWAAIPDDLTRLALVIAQRWWNARQAGFQNIDALDEDGKPVAARFFELPEWKTLRRYTVHQQQVIVTPRAAAHFGHWSW